MSSYRYLGTNKDNNKTCLYIGRLWSVRWSYNREAHHHQHIFLQDMIHCLCLPKSRLGVSSRHVACMCHTDIRESRLSIAVTGIQKAMLSLAKINKRCTNAVLGHTHSSTNTTGRARRVGHQNVIWHQTCSDSLQADDRCEICLVRCCTSETAYTRKGTFQ